MARSNTPPDFHRYQEGGAISGPIKRDKIFFFARLRSHTAGAVRRRGLFYCSHQRSKNRRLLGDELCHLRSDQARQLRWHPTTVCRKQIENPNPIGLMYLSKNPKCNLPNPTTCDSATTDVDEQFWLARHGPVPLRRGLTCAWIGPRANSNASSARFSYPRETFSTADAFPSGWDIELRYKPHQWAQRHRRPTT